MDFQRRVMSSLIRYALLAALVVLGGALSWRFFPGVTRPTATAAATTVTVPGWEKVSPNARAQNRTYAGIQLARLLEGRFAELEAEATAPSFSGIGVNGLSPAEVFCESFAYDEWTDSPEWSRFFEQLDQWSTAYPDSPHSKLARVEALINYAWAARGNGYAGSVTNEGWRLFGERLEAAFQVLDGMKALGGTEHPAYWSSRLLLARARGSESRLTLQLAEAVIDRFPEETSAYAEVCYYLLPRWHGAPGQWESWLRKQSVHMRWGAEGMPSKLYARIVWRVYRYLYDEPIFEHPALSWAKTLEGLDQLCAEYPNSDYWKTARARLAAGAGDRDAFKRAVEAMQGRFDGWAFNSKSFMEALEHNNLANRVEK